MAEGYFRDATRGPGGAERVNADERERALSSLPLALLNYVADTERYLLDMAIVGVDRQTAIEALQHMSRFEAEYYAIVTGDLEGLLQWLKHSTG